MAFLQSLRHRSAFQAGLTMLPLFTPLAVFALLGGRVTSRIGARIPAAAGLVVAAAGPTKLARATAHSGLALLVPAFLSWGIGGGLLTPAVVAAAIAAVPGERAGWPRLSTARRGRPGCDGNRGRGGGGWAAGGAGRFLRAFHAVALAPASLYGVAAVFALVSLPRALPGGRR
ncbi:hypothetical protein AV521_02365 [Streptomyces sp. IMTB 2501]|uniref:hypothetical protein n=1 Tax=Streptomyces sp. IMTB 2501 TaxID=1776340 RepID=UPI00096F0369|nr:hypothetical protein [Streptomyces sp. IMTB 2501]OLZ74504.1 hypothetical protein AV521_02365 [Streptomyces sp. IMTB 2501]